MLFYYYIERRKEMTEWWNSIPNNQKFYWFLALPFTALFILQTILTFIGIGGDSDMPDGDLDGDLDIEVDTEAEAPDTFSGIPQEGETIDPGRFSVRDAVVSFKIFTIRNIIVFFTMFSWCGIVLTNRNLPNFLAVTISLAISLTLVFALSGLLYYLSNLTEEGTLNLTNSIGTVCEVYLTIPAARQEPGKVIITIQGASRELPALTDGEALQSGTTVVVTEIINNQYLLVEKYIQNLIEEER
jgi:hypothetical protein